MVDRMGFEPICCPVCQTGGHPKQPHSPNIKDLLCVSRIASSYGFSCARERIRLLRRPRPTFLPYSFRSCGFSVSNSRNLLKTPTIGLLERDLNQTALLSDWGGDCALSSYPHAFISLLSIPFLMVSAAGLEPARVSSLASEASTFTNFATQTYKPRAF